MATPSSILAWRILVNRGAWRATLQFGSVQLPSRVRLFVIPFTVAFQASLSIINSRSLLKLMPIESDMPILYVCLTIQSE